MEERGTVNAEVAGSSPAPTAKEKPKPKIFCNEQTGYMYIQLEYKGKIATERLPLHFLKMSLEQQQWWLNASKAKKKLFNKLGYKE